MQAKCYSEDLQGTDHLGNLGADRRIIFKGILKKQGVKMWTGFNWLRLRSSVGLL
jgi:hypothetical protein